MVHRDLKCANILVTDEGEIKLSDFGASKRLKQVIRNDNEDEVVAEELSKSLKGSPYWMAPEVVRQAGHDTRADIWSIGCILIEMITGHPPWSQKYGSDARTILKVIKDSKAVPDIPDNISKECKHFLKTCLKRDPKLRPSADELSMHAFMCSYDESCPEAEADVES